MYWTVLYMPDDLFWETMYETVLLLADQGVLLIVLMIRDTCLRPIFCLGFYLYISGLSHVYAGCSPILSTVSPAFIIHCSLVQFEETTLSIFGQLEYVRSLWTSSSYRRTI